MTSRAFAFNTAEFAFDAFDDEVVILNLTSGTYYALGGCALEAWESLAHSAPLQEIADAIASRHGVAEDAVKEDLTRLVDTLVAEKILHAALPAENAPTLAVRGGNNGYLPPAFEKHADMEELLTLDPIHDVDPQKGWPHY